MPSPNDVSIIIPVYCKTEESLEWLDECLTSACAQGSEVVVHDDGSPLDIYPVVSKYSVIFSRDDRNHGVSHARNEAVANATKDIILPLDCDDRLVPGAVFSMLSIWDTTPIYPDVAKFGLESEPHYVLPDFSCDLLTKFVGFASVNVLHTVKQWRSLGGWNENIEFYEDGEYNARLFGTYCAVHFKEPLIEYRIHENQRTKTYERRSKEFALKILDNVRRYKMACKSCGGGRRTQSLNSGSNDAPMSGRFASQGHSAPVPVSLPNGVNTDLPLEFEGKVLAVYIGGQGKARHYYNGLVSKEPYKVVYGETLYVNPADAKDESNMSHPSMLLRVKRAAVTPAPEPVRPAPARPAPVPEPTIEPEPVEMVEKVVKPRSHKAEELPDISNMTYDSITAMDMTPEVARKLLVQEQHGLNRRKVTTFLNKKLKNENE